MHKLHQFIEEGKPIYVRNMSGSDPDGITKLIMLQIKPLHGPERPVKIPPIKYPVNLSAMVSPPHVLGESQDFLDMLNHGVLELVEPDEAMEELSDDRVSRIVQKATRDLYNRNVLPEGRKKARASAGAQGERRRVPKTELNDDDIEVNNPLAKAMDAAAKGDIVLSNSDAEVNARVVQMCATMNADAGTADDYLDDLEAMPDGELTDADLGHIMRHVKIAKVMDWAESKLAERSGEEDEDPAPKSSKKRKKKGRRR